MSDSMPVVLLVENEPQIRRFVGLALKAEGWKILPAASSSISTRDTRRSNTIHLSPILNCRSAS